MMPRAGQADLIRSALISITLHQLIVLPLNNKALTQLNTILHGFLWVGREDALPCQLGQGMLSVVVQWLGYS
jgi:hypothetical protein